MEKYFSIAIDAYDEKEKLAFQFNTTVKEAELKAIQEKEYIPIRMGNGIDEYDKLPMYKGKITNVEEVNIDVSESGETNETEDDRDQ